MTGLSDMIAESEPEKAIELLRRSVALDPSAGTYHRLAMLQNKAGNSIATLLSRSISQLRSRATMLTYYEEREAHRERVGRQRRSNARAISRTGTVTLAIGS